MSNDTVTPYVQKRQTKLGLAIVTIRPEGDLVEATVTISYDDTIFRAEGIFSSARESFLWAYGVKQSRNDRYAGYQAKDANLVESKPAKGKTADVISIRDAVLESQTDYDNFTLAKASKVDVDKVSIKSLTTSSLLSEDDKIIMANLLAKLGKVSHG